MEKSLTNAIANALKAGFENSKVFSMPIKQGLTGGDFLVDIKNISNSLMPADMFKRTIEFSITAFTTKELLEKLDILLKMEEVLKLIDCEGLKYRAYFEKSEIGEDNVVLYPRYTFYTKEHDAFDENESFMENFTINKLEE